MSLRITSGRAGRQLASALADCLGVEPTPCAVAQFPDGELRPRVGAIRGDDVYLVHPTGPPVHDSLVELVLLLDACRRAGAARTTAVMADALARLQHHTPLDELLVGGHAPVEPAPARSRP